MRYKACGSNFDKKIFPTIMFNWLKKIPPASEKARHCIAGAPAKEAKEAKEALCKTDVLTESSKYKKQGNEFLAEGRLEEAAGCYKQAVTINPEYAEGFLNLGFVLKAQNRFEEAERHLKRAVAINPGLEDAYYILGALSQEQGNLDGAIENFNKVLELNPELEYVYIDLYTVLLQRGQIENAKRVIKQGISIYPKHAEFHLRLGDLYRHEKESEKATSCYQRALSIQPDYAEANNKLGAAYHDLGDLDMAQVCYNRALALNPDDADVHNNLGSVFHERGDMNKAEACYRRAIALKPDFFEAYNNLGYISAAQGNPHESLSCYRQALALKPDSAEVHNNLGVQLRVQGKLDEAVACFRKAVALKPDLPDAYNNLGAAFMDQGNREEAISCFRQTLLFKPDSFLAHNNLGVVYQLQGRLDKALVCYRQALLLAPELHEAKANLLFASQQLCEWKDLETLSNEVRRAVREEPSTAVNRIPPFSFLTIPGSTLSEQKICAGNWAQRKCKSIVHRPDLVFEFDRKPKQKLHIGYLSADFRNHPVALLMAEVFELHDCERFHITAYSYGVNDGSAVRKRLEKAFSHFEDIRDFSDEDSARKIFHDRIDILIDLTGYTRDGRSEILAFRPAPVQVSYIGYLGTMGGDFMDYIIADPFLIPSKDQKFYSEKVAYLPSYQANDRQCHIAEAPSRKACGLPEQGIVFCCFNQTYKISPDVFDVWMRLLTTLPGSVLWLYASTPQAVDNLRREAQARGVSPQRLIFAENRPRDQHLARLKCADLFLDTMQVNAGTTASDALWAGLPVITCAGKTFSSRMGGSLLTALDVPELITYNLDDYYRLALELATDGEKREKTRQKIISNRDTAPLFDSRLFTQNLEAAYLHMWNEYLAPSTK